MTTLSPCGMSARWRRKYSCGVGPATTVTSFLQDSILLAERQRVGRRSVETVEPDNDVNPIVARRERHLDFGYDPVRPVGVHRLVQILPRQFERARFRLERHDAQAQHIAEIAQAAPGDRADAAGPAGDEAGDRSGPPGGREHPQFLPGRFGTPCRRRSAARRARRRRVPVRSSGSCSSRRGS